MAPYERFYMPDTSDISARVNVFLRPVLFLGGRYVSQVFSII
jgi:hypothetical protein